MKILGRGTNMQRDYIMKKNNKGFTLVELIVVLVILAVLAAILVPALLGYIDRAKNQQYIVEAKDLMTATQAGIAEAYALDKESFINAVRPSECSLVEENYGYYTNYALRMAQDKKSMSVSTDPAKENGARAKNIISKKVVQYAEAFPYKFHSSFDNNNQKVSDLGNNVGFVILFNLKGRIVYMQYARNNRLVTYNGKSFDVQNGKDLTFDKFRN